MLQLGDKRGEGKIRTCVFGLAHQVGKTGGSFHPFYNEQVRCIPHTLQCFPKVQWFLQSGFYYLMAFLVVVGLAFCTVFFHGAVWAIYGLVGCLSMYMFWAMYRSTKDISMNLVKHPKYRLEKSKATFNTILGMVYHFFCVVSLGDENSHR